MSQSVHVELDGPVALVTLSRPEKRNAIDLEMFRALSDSGRRLAGTPGVRAVVLCGAGEHFCAGIDTSVFSAGQSDELLALMEPLPGTPANLFQHAALVWREMPVPVIAALSGAVFGAGLQIAMGADLRIAAPDTRCSVMEIRWGIIPDMGITNTARHLVRVDHLRELIWTGRIVEATEARALGLVSSVSDEPLAAARELAATIARQSPDAIRAAKRLLRSGLDEAPERALEREADLQLGLLGYPNQLEAVAANVERRAPNFADPAAG